VAAAAPPTQYGAINSDGYNTLKSIWSTSTSTQPKKYLKHKYKYIISKVFKIQVPKYLLLGVGATSKCINMYGNVVTIKFWLIVNENN